MGVVILLLITMLIPMPVLKESGYQNLAELLGGLAAWKAAGYPIEGNAAITA